MIDYTKKIEDGIKKYSKPINPEVYSVLVNFSELKEKYNSLSNKYNKQKSKVFKLTKYAQKLKKELNFINNRRLSLLYLKWKYETLNNNLEMDINNLNIKTNHLEQRQKVIDDYNDYLLNDMKCKTSDNA